LAKWFGNPKMWPPPRRRPHLGSPNHFPTMSSRSIHRGCRRNFRKALRSSTLHSLWPPGPEFRTTCCRGMGVCVFHHVPRDDGNNTPLYTSGGGKFGPWWVPIVKTRTRTLFIAALSTWLWPMPELCTAMCKKTKAVHLCSTRAHVSDGIRVMSQRRWPMLKLCTPKSKNTKASDVHM
jgi:hypothetical protein